MILSSKSSPGVLEGELRGISDCVCVCVCVCDSEPSQAEFSTRGLPRRASLQVFPAQIRVLLEIR